MNNVNLQTELKECSDAIKYAERILRKAPAGTLIAAEYNNHSRYYIREDKKDKHGRYISKSNTKLISELAQKAYAKKLLKVATDRKKQIIKLITMENSDSIKDVYYKFSKSKQDFIIPFVITDEDFAKKWLDVKYDRFYEPIGDDVIYTERGEAVRSKSEKILADKFLTMNIPYHYEKPLWLKGYGDVHPDFTLLNTKTRKEYYWEHLGMMDNVQYLDKTIKKIELMKRNGIFEGENLILTYETSTHPLNMKVVESMLERYF